MKFSSKFKKTISSFFLIIFFSVSNLSLFTPRAQAQVFGGGGGNASGGVSVQGIGAVALGCSTAFFVQRKSIKAAAVAEGAAESAAVNAAGQGIGTVIGVNPADALNGGTPTPEVPVVDNNIPPSIKAEVGKVNTETTLQSFKEECLDLIARYVVLKIIDKITFMTVEWINSGFEGNPFYPEDRANFFEQIAKDEVTSFTSWFSLNPADYPFGRIISETILLTVQNRLQDNLRFSLNQVLQHSNQYATYENFQAQFSVGGWAGYSAFAQMNNNVFGNYIMAQNHLARQTAGTNINIAKNFQAELNEAGGLLNQRVCRLTETGDPNDEYIDRNDERHMGDYTIMPPDGLVSDILNLLPPAVQAEFSGVNDPAAQREVYNYLVQRSKCAKWETVTPGRFIAEQTSQALGSPLRNLELADEFNENLGLIFDALAAQLFEQGLRAFQRSDGQYSSNPNDPNYNALWAQSNDPDFGTNSNQQSTQEIIQGGSAGGGTNTGGSPSLNLLQVQQNYLIRANTGVQTINTLIRDIRALDYCVPGPNPKWYEVGSVNLQNSITSAVSQSGDGAYYAQAVQELTGISIPDSAVPNFTQFNAFINFALARYRDEVYANYAPLQPPPAIRPVATSQFSQIPNLQTQAQILDSRINNLIPAIPQLEVIVNQFLGLTPTQQADPNSTEMQTITSLLNQLLSQGALVTQDQLDQLNSEIFSYENQISTVNGYIAQCVQEVSSNNYAGLEERVSYPFPSIFDNPLINQTSLQPNVTRFLSNINFGDTNSEINLAGFNGLNLTIPTTSTETFTLYLQSLY
ncbi:MAG: hypothetical protein R3B65_00075 [Candidatus Paceibacterota bacterium]